MCRKTRKKDKNEKGAIMIEAIVVYPITLFLLFFILSIFSVLFQAWNIRIIANETAAKVAQTYRLSAADISTGYLTERQLNDISHYRYILGNKDLENEARKKIVDYAKLRLSKTTYTKNVKEPEITVEVESSALARRYIVVQITGEYTVPFGEALSYFGFNSITKYTATAYAECLDLIDYINTVDFVDNQLDLGIFDSKFIGMINKILSLFQKISSLFK